MQLFVPQKTSPPTSKPCATPTRSGPLCWPNYSLGVKLAVHWQHARWLKGGRANERYVVHVYGKLRSVITMQTQTTIGYRMHSPQLSIQELPPQRLLNSTQLGTATAIVLYSV